MTEPTDQSRMAAAVWREANREAIVSSNDWVEAHGLPLAHRRLF